MVHKVGARDIILFTEDGDGWLVDEVTATAEEDELLLESGVRVDDDAIDLSCRN